MKKKWMLGSVERLGIRHGLANQANDGQGNSPRTRSGGRRRGRTVESLVFFVVVASVVAMIVPLLWLLHLSSDDRWSSPSTALEHAADLALLMGDHTGGGRRRRSGPGAAIVEAYVISFSQGSVDEFLVRNNHSNLNVLGHDILHVPAIDGYSQRTLDLWGEISSRPPLNATHYDRDDPRQRSEYKSPHAVGCHLSHWYLMKQFAHRSPEFRPDAYLVFEDDSSCVPNLMETALRVIHELPPDWDVLFLGGKPLTRYNNVTMPQDLSKDEIRQKICRGEFGVGHSPLAPDGSRNLNSSSQRYWRTKYILNTNAYAINPLHVAHIAKVLRPKNYVPLDVFLSTRADHDELILYMTPKKMCIQPIEVGPEMWEDTNGIMKESMEWEGSHWFDDMGFHWDRMILDGEGCISGRY